MPICYIGLGTNLGDPLKQALLARHTLSESPLWTLSAVSSLYRSRPMGPQDQPDYLNAVVALETSLSPEALLDALQAIEQQQGRQRLRRWGERTLDLDILLYGDQVLSSERLQVPHTGMTQREFVLLPLVEIAPELHLPDGRAVKDLAAAIDNNGLHIAKRPMEWVGTH
ncbi:MULTISPECIES: 2-amino-4-hydroxy-6-hydroxymethyldihydropteridine diphosphokinase [Aliagarivorans]|uniref:2-amino-4-hydroxy-6- hydroxymethyldihydropteridine diphosphokinase n=1 Tax=Aliagarivorans TaxID=882379 RepID=UPI00041565E4|nr:MULTISPECIES: 2-amino-4-hydroxy-6-hydroxymethyldihydropteridine diphosphokinase [Aliagarivorans]